MSIISIRESVALSARETILVEISRPFINAMTLSVFSSAVLTGQVGVRISANGQTILPVPANGANNDIWLENHAPVLLVVNKEVNGPPYQLEIIIDNTLNASAVFLTGILEVYNTPYPQTRIKLPDGKHGEADPFALWLAELSKREENR